MDNQKALEIARDRIESISKFITTNESEKKAAEEKKKVTENRTHIVKSNSPTKTTLLQRLDLESKVIRARILLERSENRLLQIEWIIF